MKIKNSLVVFVATVFVTAALLAGGCTPTKTGSTQKASKAEWEYVPSIWVESDSFNQYRNCVYDEGSAGYLCPPGTR